MINPQRRPRTTGVTELGLTQLEVSGNGRSMYPAFDTGIVHLQTHDAVEAGEGQLRLLPATQHLRYLGHGRHHARGKDGRGHQRADGQITGPDQRSAEQHHQGTATAQQAISPAPERVKDAAQAHTPPGRDAVVVVPLLLKTLLGLQALDVVRTLHRLHQHGTAQGRLAHRFAGQPAQRLLHQQPGNHHQQQGHYGHPHQRTGDVPQDAAEQDEEWQVREGGYRSRGHQLAYLLELPYLRNEGTGGPRPLAGPDSQGLPETPVGDAEVGPFANKNGDPEPRTAQQTLEHHGDDYPPERPGQGGHRLGRNDPVIDLAGKQDTGQGQHVG